MLPDQASPRLASIIEINKNMLRAKKKMLIFYDRLVYKMKPLVSATFMISLSLFMQMVKKMMVYSSENNYWYKKDKPKSVINII